MQKGEPLIGYKINARALAEGLWGKGATKAEKTNRKGVGYYKCLSNEGYVINPDALTGEEKESISRYGNFIQKIAVLVQRQSTGDMVVGVSYRGEKRNFSYFLNRGQVYWTQLEMFVFPKECDVLTICTNIGLK